ncbi:hypothetical protein F5I97DRAFT_1505378 [Phlebopus sp. FC_14]|nr:hypothetical protein F5I97DRAFT_1505378 [Phlebopus sp. FC_14]
MIYRYMGKLVALFFFFFFLRATMPASAAQTPSHLHDVPQRYITRGLSPTPQKKNLCTLVRRPRAVPTDQDWPPTILFEVGYASALLRSWGVERLFIHHVSPAWDDDFYGRTQQREENRRRRDAPCAHRNDKSAGPDTWDLLLVVQYMLKGKVHTAREEHRSPTGETST